MDGVVLGAIRGLRNSLACVRRDGTPKSERQQNLAIKRNSAACHHQTKKERRNQDRSRSPDQGAEENSTWPTLPLGSVTQVPLLFFKDPKAQVGRFPESSNLTLTRHFRLSVSRQISSRPLVVHRSPVFHLPFLLCQKGDPCTTSNAQSIHTSNRFPYPPGDKFLRRVRPLTAAALRPRLDSGLSRPRLRVRFSSAVPSRPKSICLSVAY